MDRGQGNAVASKYWEATGRLSVPAFESRVMLFGHLASSPNERPPQGRCGTAWRRKLGRFAVAFCGAIVTVIASGSANVSVAELAIGRIELGLAGQVKVGVWSPIAVELSRASGNSSGDAGPARLEIIVPDSDGGQVTFAVPGETISLGIGETKRVVRYIKLGSPRSPITVRLRSADRVVTEKQFAGDDLPTGLPSTTPWTVVLGPQSLVDRLQVTRDARVREQGTRQAVSRIADSADLPDAWQGYEGVDELVITTREPGLLETMTDRQWSALEQWCRLGGHLTISVGQRGGEVLAADGPLRRLVGGQFIRTTVFRNTSVLESFVESAQRIPDGEPLHAVILQQAPGRVELAESLGLAGVSPLLVRRPFGFGQIVVVAFDVDSPRIADWPALPALLSRAITGEQPRTAPARRSGEGGQVTHLGYTDLVGQLRAAMEQFPGITFVQFSWVAGLLVLYIALIGPLDFLLLRRLGGHMHWTWVTLPVMIAGFIAIAVILQNHSRGDRAKLNQVEIFDLDVATGQRQGVTWFHLYSPTSQQVDVRYQIAKDVVAGSANPGMLLSWHGLPGHGLGGLDSPSGSPLGGDDFTCQTDVVASEAGAGLMGLPVPAGATRSLLARWWSQETPPTGLDSLTADENGLIHGELNNPFSFPLRDVMLLYENWAYRLDRPLAPGQVVLVDSLKPLNLQWRLTRRRVVEHSDITTPWERSSTDLPRILEMLLFHGAAGGASYTHLTHRYQPYLDLSPKLLSGRAILVGQAGAPVGELQLGTTPFPGSERQSWTYCRLLLPVASQPPTQ